MSNNNEFWQSHWNNLEAQMTKKSLDFQFWKRQGVPRMHTLQKCIEGLKDFAKMQKEYFEINFVENGKYPRDFVFSRLFSQVTNDLEVLERAAYQRCSASKEMKDALYIADRLAYAALSPVKLAPTITVVTYIQKSTSIRVIPYSDVAFIGIPYTCIAGYQQVQSTLSIPDKYGAQDYLAIPHELGHFLFWRGIVKYNGQTRSIYDVYQMLFNDADESERVYYEWSEEIFADVYGCLIADAFISKDFQDLQRRKSLSEFLHNDGEHPRPIIRPDIYTHVMRQKNSHLADQLNEEWDTLRTETLKKIAPERKLAIENELSVVKKITDFTFDLFDDAIDEEKVCWWRDGLAESKINTLYSTFASKFQEEQLVDLPIAELGEDIIVKDTVEDLQGMWEKRSEDADPTLKWLPVLEAGGWLTKGPECEGPGTCG